MSTSAWRIFSVADLTRGLAAGETAYKEFLRTATLTGAVYRLPAGARDMQAPHLEDEVYWVVEGHAWVSVGDSKREVRAGDILYVQATEEHSFFDIDEDLTLIAVFGPLRT